MEFLEKLLLSFTDLYKNFLHAYIILTENIFQNFQTYQTDRWSNLENLVKWTWISKFPLQPPSFEEFEYGYKLLKCTSFDFAMNNKSLAPYFCIFPEIKSLMKLNQTRIKINQSLWKSSTVSIIRKVIIKRVF